MYKLNNEFVLVNEYNVKWLTGIIGEVIKQKN